MSYDQFMDDRKTYSATIRELEIIGEATAKVSDDVKGRYPEIPWQQIKAFRNVAIWGHFFSTSAAAGMLKDATAQRLPRVVF